MSFNTKEIKILGTLSIGTFLEYFDFYLYLHFASVLNKVFFEIGDAHSTALLTSFAYVSAFAFRPIGAILFGYIGDKYGAKTVLNITFVLMGISCIGIATLPSYDNIGVFASVMLTLYRAMQGISSMGEVVGGMVYLTQNFKGRQVFQGIGILILMCSVSCLVALAGINLAVNGFLNWRFLFLAGICIFAVARYARKSLIQCPFNNKTIKYSDIPLKTYLASFSVELCQPVALFISIIGVNNILRNEYGFMEIDIINRNTTTVLFHIFYVICAIFAVGYVNPYKLGIYRFLAGFFLMICSPLMMDSLQSLLWFQNLISLLLISDICTAPIVYKNIPKEHRFKITSLAFALSRAFVMILTSYGLILLQPILGKFTFVIFSVPFLLFYYWGFRYFKRLDDVNPHGILKALDK